MAEIGLGRMSLEQHGYMNYVHLPTQCLHLVQSCQSMLDQGEESYYLLVAEPCAWCLPLIVGPVSLEHWHGLHSRREDMETAEFGLLVQEMERLYRTQLEGPNSVLFWEEHPRRYLRTSPRDAPMYGSCKA